jgi:FtsH-binding integral membrane protein
VATMVARAPKMRADDIFFPAMALLILGIVVTGFGRSYFLAGMILAKLPNRLVHVHGAVFVAWIILLVTQTWLVAMHKTKWHRKLGVLSLVLLPSMFILGILTLFDFIRRAQPDEGPEVLLVGDMEILLVFVGLTSWGLLTRRDAASHKRLMILGTIAIMGPAIGRWNFGIPVALGIIFALPLLVLAYDLWTLRRVHRTTAVANALTAAWVLTLVPFSKLAFWHQCVEWIRHT